MIQIGVLGYGYWGPNLTRVFTETPDVSVRWVADASADRIDAAHQRHPGIRTTTDPHQVFADPDVDAVVIATPAATHAPLAIAAFRAGKHVLVEKPMAMSSEDAARVIDAAERAGRVLMVDHTFVYTSAVREVQRLVRTGVVGDVVCWDAMRTSLGRFQPDAGVLWDLATHDLAILDFVLGEAPSSLTASGVMLATTTRPDAAMLTLRFGPSRLAHIHVNWVAAQKVRRTTIVGTRGTIEYDEAEPASKVKVYERDRQADDPGAVAALRVAHRAGCMWTPSLDTTEPLRVMAAHFVECIETGRTPDSDGAAGQRVVAWLETAEQAIVRQTWSEGPSGPSSRPSGASPHAEGAEAPSLHGAAEPRPAPRR